MNPEREKYLTIFETIPNPAFILDVEDRVDNINNAAFDLFRDVLPAGASYYGKAQIGGILPWLKEALEAFVGGEDLETTFEKDVETRKGLIHFQIKLKRMLDLYEKFVGTIITLNDISYLKQAERTVARASDFYLTLFEEFPLTGLPNRRLLETDLPRVIARTGRGVDSVVLVMDLDRFKNVNDTFGHNAGDQVLIDISKILLKQLRRDSDLLTRLGGEEFAVLFEDLDIGEAGGIAQRLRESVATSDFLPDRGGIRLSLSVGLALIKERETPEVILSRADNAMYRAKELGRNRIIIAE